VKKALASAMSLEAQPKSKRIGRILLAAVNKRVVVDANH
jgi:hypothetical protein